MYRIGGKQGMNYLENYYANYDEEGRLALHLHWKVMKWMRWNTLPTIWKL